MHLETALKFLNVAEPTRRIPAGELTADSFAALGWIRLPMLPWLRLRLGRQRACSSARQILLAHRTMFGSAERQWFI